MNKSQRLPMAVALLIFSAFLLWVAQVNLSNPQPPRYGKNGLQKHALIAHALGGIDGHAYTNTREAFLYNYAQGHRVFEVDLTLSADGHMILRHDGDFWGRLGQTMPERLQEELEAPPTLEEATSQPIWGVYPPMTLEELLGLMAAHPDALLVTDTKYTDQATVQKQFQLLVEAASATDDTILDRIVPQIYNQPMLRWIDGVYAFPDVIYSLNVTADSPGDVMQFVTANPRVVAITFLVRFLPAYARYLPMLREKGVAAYINTVNDPDTFARHRQAGLSGVYTDFLVPQRLAAE
jgi:glycerophosphoryl diester phosphodiesterase